MSFQIASRRGRGLGPEPRRLLVGIVELAVPVGQLPSGDDELKPIGEGRILAGYDEPAGTPRSDSGR